MVAIAPAAAPCSKRFSDSPCRIEGTCMVFPFARHVSERGHGHPDGFRFSKLIMKTERFAMAYRLILRIRLISVRSLSKIAHIYRFDCDRGRWRSLQGLKAVTDIQGNYSP